MKRAQGKQTHRCSVCGSVQHRIERCPLPGAKKLQLALKKVQDLQNVKKPQNKVLRKERKQRKKPQTNRNWKGKAMKSYQCRDVVRKASPSEIRRVVSNRHCLDAPDNEEDAVQWLLVRRWASAPKKCEDCDCKRFSRLTWQEDRQCFWRCLDCEKRHGLLSASIFRGLRMSAQELVMCLLAYTSASFSAFPKVADMVQVRMFAAFVDSEK